MMGAKKNEKSKLEIRFPDVVRKDEREGFGGYIVESKSLIEVATTLRDEFGYDYLTSVTGVDYIEEDKMEAVYHFYRSTGGSAIVLHVQAPRSNPVIPSLYKEFHGVDFQEREAWDLLGIKFEGHPDLRRILMWEGFAGHPLRKDWKEAFYEEDTKPYSTRWPEGEFEQAEDQNVFGKNVKYPNGLLDPESVKPEHEDLLYAGLTELAKKSDDDFETEQVLINMGPQHPSTHGVFRMAVVADGETITALKPVMGYLHRNHEKICERNSYIQNIPFTDRLDYIASMSNNFGYVMAVEKLLNITDKVPERAEYIRVIMAELTRISNHFWAIGFLLNDLGAYFTPALYAIQERELILDIFEAVTGARMMNNYMRFGGVAKDILPDALKRIEELVVERLPRKTDELDGYLSKNELLVSRTEGIGILTPEEAIAYGAVGPVLRASGVPYDIRRADPYSIYDRFDFDVAVRYHGDTYDRYLIRMDEIRQSLRIIQQALRDLPAGPIQLKKAYNIVAPKGEAYGRVEGPKGELGFYIVSDGTSNPYRFHVRSPSFINLTGLEKMSVGQKVADVVVILGSIDIILGEVDR